MYQNKAYECASIRNYAAAERHFNETKPVKSRKGTWGSDERPLRKRSQHHYRLKHGTWQGRNFYDLMHYKTTLIRYWEPFDNGDAVVSLLHHGSISSRSFMAAHHWYALKKFDTATSEVVYAGVCSAHSTLNLWFDGREEAFGEYFSTHLVLTPEGKLDTTASVMVPVASPAVSEHRKGLRAVVRKELAVIKDIMLMQFGRLSERDNLSYSLGRPFSCSKSAGSTEWHTINHLFSEKAYGSGITSEQEVTLTHALIDIANDVYDTLASRIAYSEGAIKPKWLIARTGEPPPSTKPTFDQFIKAYERVIMGAVRLDKPDDQRLLNGDGLFPPTRTYPRTARFARPDKDSFAYNVLPARIDTLVSRLSKV
jgi:hypothetical protein